MPDYEQNLIELNNKNNCWNKKPLLRKIYHNFYHLIKSNLGNTDDGIIMELGSGIGKIKEVIPECYCTDQFDNSYIDSAENAYALSCQDRALSNLILFDVFHHLEYPGDALDEFYRALGSSGRLLLFEPYLSLLGMLVYGVFHPEPLAIGKKIKWNRGVTTVLKENDYYAAQGNATRLFCWHKHDAIGKKWKTLKIIKLPAISYIASGGYTGPQLYPEKILSFIQKIDWLCSYASLIFATRVLIVLEKK